MIATITDCPFANTDHLAQCASDGVSPLDAQITAILDDLKKTQLNPDTITRLDDLILAAVNASQNATIRRYICDSCDCDPACHPVK